LDSNNSFRRIVWRIGTALLLPLLWSVSGCQPTSSVVKTGANGAGTQTQTAAPAPVTDRFRNVAQESGLAAFTHTDGSSGRKFFVEQMGAGVALFDFDNDGWLDVYFCSGAALPGYKGAKPSNKLFRNKHDGTFEDVTDKAGVGSGRYCIGAAVGDFNNDGWLDLYLSGFGGNTLYQNRGDGTFADVTKKAGVFGGKLSSSSAWGDYDGDGKLDLYVCNYVQYKIEEDLFCSKFAGQKSYCGPNLYKPEIHLLYHNNGNGTFTDVTKTAGISTESGNGLGVTWCDYNGDNRPDIFVANDQSPNFLWRNDGKGKFTNVAEDLGVAFGEQGHAQAGMGIDSGDFNNDGKMDFLMTTFSEESRALYRQEDFGFQEISFAVGIGTKTLMYLGFGCAFVDYDRDGLLDLFFANGHVLDDIAKYSDSVTWAQPNQLFRNKGDKTFEEVSQQTGISEGKHVGRGAAIGDLFNRGCPDIVVSVLRGKPVVMKNESAPNAHWISLDLHAAWGNPQAIGAKVQLTANGVTQTKEVKASNSYASSSDPRPLFGLGNAAKIDEIKIRWNSGKTTLLKEPKIDQILRVDEPK